MDDEEVTVVEFDKVKLEVNKKKFEQDIAEIVSKIVEENINKIIEENLDKIIQQVKEKMKNEALT